MRGKRVTRRKEATMAPDGSNGAMLIVHADDYGITPNQSRRILSHAACDGAGALNSLSVIVGSPRFAECADILDAYVGRLLIGMHLNLVEGRCCADPSSVPLLVDGAGMFNRSFVGLLQLSLAQGGELRRQVAREAAAQLDAYCNRFPALAVNLRIDSHQHTHLIPAVLDGLLDAVRSAGLSAGYLRVPAEPSGPFTASADAFGRVLPVNWAKHLLLNALWRLDRRTLEDAGIPSGIFCGINFSGHMTAENVATVFMPFWEEALDQGRPLELLFHPGGIDRAEDCLNPALPGFVEFYRSEFRRLEGDALDRFGSG